MVVYKLLLVKPGMSWKEVAIDDFSIRVRERESNQPELTILAFDDCVE